MNLNVLERLLLLNHLPKEGDITTIKLVRKLRESLSFSEDEHKKLKFAEQEGRVTWQENIEKDVYIGAKTQEIIVDTLLVN